MVERIPPSETTSTPRKDPGVPAWLSGAPELGVQRLGDAYTPATPAEPMSAGKVFAYSFGLTTLVWGLAGTLTLLAAQRR